MEHSFFLTNANSSEMTIFGSNDHRKPHGHQDSDRSSVYNILYILYTVYWLIVPVSVMSNIYHGRMSL